MKFERILVNQVYKLDFDITLHFSSVTLIHQKADIACEELEGKFYKIIRHLHLINYRDG